MDWYSVLKLIMWVDLALLIFVIVLIVMGVGQAYPDWCADYQCRWR
jgi:hypothetical protein